MQKKKSGSGILVIAMIVLFFAGLVFGMVIIHLVDKKHEGQLTDEFEARIEEMKKPVNVYFPARNIEYGQIPRNSYKPENYRNEDGYMAYYNDEGEKITHIGVDLSYHNEEIDWDELKNTPVEFAMIRCGYRGNTEGGLKEDTKFKEYAAAANKSGIHLGTYFFSQAITVEEAVEEADYVIDLIKDYDISYPVAFDTEYVEGEELRFNQADPSREELTDICIAFCERIREAGYYPIIYASENWIRRRLDVERLTDYDIWAPQYNEENDFLYDFTIWQYTAAGEVPGITGKCDVNVSFIDYANYVPALRDARDTNGELGVYNPNNPSITIMPEEGNDDDSQESQNR